MARKRSHEEHANHEAWAIPYADLMTLLLAFFVVMYALSTVNEAKYRVMADAMRTAFGGQPHTMAPVQVGDQALQGSGGERPTPIKSSPPLSVPDPNRLSSSRTTPVSLRDSGQMDRAQRQLDAVASRLSHALSPLINKKLITVRRSELWIEVEINSDILFGAGSATLGHDARQTLDALAAVLSDAPNGVRVEGYTDNTPIATAQFPSNWELSAARAATVVHLFADQGVDPARLSMIGYGQFRPRADNATPAGRNANRRVLLVILADGGASVQDPAPQPVLATGAPATPTPVDAAPASRAPAVVPAAIEGVN
ncbi:flagellar motor protein MotD [Pseudoxanthomonas sp. JBR18]|uniref:flagellar motor protein MotD n=1 Tax=Pseudoxanthomonas sp. JBR18 TaxID=2969308 RepID=UPI0023066319|nr:flagellar motor protein MotD [Pseudoxanthomonas sp. JBR18]WCE03711.1 flagellar motor protein MotD [Pseudoxanthomonas sp. JBR18]